MRLADFGLGIHGELVEIPGGKAFVPRPLPREILLPPNLLRELGTAHREIGLLQGKLEQLPGRGFLLLPFITREAVLSSKIEGTVTTLEQAFENKIITPGGETEIDDDGNRVRNYEFALEAGAKEVQAGRSLTEHTIRSMHGILSNNDPTMQGHAGRYRQNQVAIGKTGDIATARFVPPPPHLVTDCMQDLVRYLRDDKDQDPLIKLALTHYQFETIHPFNDGNGRVGRMLISLQMVSENVIPDPYLHLSYHMELHKSEYVNALYKTSCTGDFRPWIEFFLLATQLSAVEMSKRIYQLKEKENEFTEAIRGRGEIVLRAIRFLFSSPYFFTSMLQTALSCSAPSARDAVITLEQCKIIEKLGAPLRGSRQRGRPPAVYVCRDILQIMNGALP